MSQGLHHHQGTALGGDAHIVQSLKRLLSTPKGTRVMRRDYGCDIHELVDAPNHPTTWMQAQAAIADAIFSYESDRIDLQSVRVLEATAAGRFHVAIEAMSKLSGEAISFEEVV